MEIVFPPELEAELSRMAHEKGQRAEQLVQELVASYVDHENWFKTEVDKGLASLDRGEFVTHEEMKQRVERLLGG